VNFSKGIYGDQEHLINNEIFNCDINLPSKEMVQGYTKKPSLEGFSNFNPGIHFTGTFRMDLKVFNVAGVNLSHLGVKREKSLKKPNRLGLGFLLTIKPMIYIKIKIDCA